MAIRKLLIWTRTIPFLFIGVFPLSLFSQSMEPSDPLVRDQNEGRRRVEDLIKKMERLSERFRKEGRAYAADLLDRAVEFARKQNIPGTMIDIERDLKEGSLWSSATKSEELVKELKKLLNILFH